MLHAQTRARFYMKFGTSIFRMEYYGISTDLGNKCEHFEKENVEYPLAMQAKSSQLLLLIMLIMTQARQPPKIRFMELAYHCVGTEVKVIIVQKPL